MATASLRTLSPNSSAYSVTSTEKSENIANTVTAERKTFVDTGSLCRVIGRKSQGVAVQHQMWVLDETLQGKAMLCSWGEGAWSVFSVWDEVVPCWVGVSCKNGCKILLTKNFPPMSFFFEVRDKNTSPNVSFLFSGLVSFLLKSRAQIFFIPAWYEARRRGR